MAFLCKPQNIAQTIRFINLDSDFVFSSVKSQSLERLSNCPQSGGSTCFPSEISISVGQNLAVLSNICLKVNLVILNYAQLEYKHKAPSLHVTPPDAKPVLAVRCFLSLSILQYIVCEFWRNPLNKS